MPLSLPSDIQLVNNYTTVDTEVRELPVSQIVLHDTAGSATNPDRNITDVATMSARENGTLAYLTQGNSAQTNIHYMVGPEATGAKVYQCVPESLVCYHAAGNGQSYKGRHSMANEISIGIEVWGMPGEPKGPKQTRSVVCLVADIARRYHLKPSQIVSHKSIQSDRSDGEAFLAAARAAVAAGNVGGVPEVDNTNGKLVGPGVREMLKQLGHKAETNEQYSRFSSGEQFSLTWASGADAMYLYFAAEKPDGSWPVQVFRKVV